MHKCTQIHYSVMWKAVTMVCVKSLRGCEVCLEDCPLLNTILKLSGYLDLDRAKTKLVMWKNWIIPMHTDPM